MSLFFYGSKAERVEKMIDFLQTLPPELIGIFTFCFCACLILGAFRFFGAAGLYLYSAVALLAANIQVLKAVQFSFMPKPVALGTVVFASTFVAADLLTEYYGKKAALKGVWIGFYACLMMMGLMYLTLGMKPLPLSLETLRFVQSHYAIETLFTPAPAILAASLISYLISQGSDILIYALIKGRTGNRALWLRTNLSTLISAFLDTTIFSVLAWVVFSPHPVDGSTLFYTYILGTYLMRALVSLFNTPLMYVVRLLKPREEEKIHEFALSQL